MTTWKSYGYEIVSGPKYDRRSYRIATMVLNGASFTEAGQALNMSKQAAQKRFWKAIVNRPFKLYFGDIVKDIEMLRNEWKEFSR